MIDLAPSSVLGLVLVGLVAGFVNTLAGGGSLLVVPFLVAHGIPDTAANGTSRIGLVAQNAVAAVRYDRDDMVDWPLVRRLVIPSMIGAAIGAWAGARLDDRLFRHVLAWVMLGVAAAVVVKAPKALSLTHRMPRWLVWPVFLLIGVFGGMIQAGVGYLILGALVLGMGVPLASANVVKVALIAAYTPVALTFFAVEGKVGLAPGLIVTVGQAVGGWFAAAQALERGEPLIRKVLAVAITATALHLLGVTTWVWGLVR